MLPSSFQARREVHACQVNSLCSTLPMSSAQVRLRLLLIVYRRIQYSIQD